MTAPGQGADADSVQGSLTLFALLLACYATLSVVGVVLAKRWIAAAVVELRDGNVVSGPVLAALAGASAYALSFGLWLFISTRAPLSVAYPVAVGVTMTLTVAAGALVFGERPMKVQLLGCALVLLGIGMLSSGLRR